MVNLRPDGFDRFQALESHAMADSTRLPISHPDHSLGAGLGPTSETDDEDVDPTDATDTDVEGGLPWKPKFNKVYIVSHFELFRFNL